MLGQVLIIKWDGLYARLLADAVRTYYPTARIVVEQSAAEAKHRIESQHQDLVVTGLTYADGDGLPWLLWMVESTQVASLLLVSLRRDAQTLGFLRSERRLSVFDPAIDPPGALRAGAGSRGARAAVRQSLVQRTAAGAGGFAGGSVCASDTSRSAWCCR
jgi:response regulator of citrate/malate metabolism